MTETKIVELKLPCDIDGLAQFFNMVRYNGERPERSTKIINQLLLKLGFETVRLKPQHRPKLNLNDDIKLYTEQKGKEIANRIANAIHGKNVKSMDVSKARYLIESALMKFECYIDNRRLCKKQLDEWLGYSSRTMRVQQYAHGEKIDNEELEEYRIIAEIHEDLINFITT